MNYSNADQAAMMGRPAYMTGANQAPTRPQTNVISGYQPNTAFHSPMQTGVGGAYHDFAGHNYAEEEPYVAPEPIVQALRQRSLNPEGIRRNAKTFRGTGNAPVAPEGKTNPSGANRSAQVTSQV
jgi:hypothetical protein